MHVSKLRASVSLHAGGDTRSPLEMGYDCSRSLFIILLPSHFCQKRLHQAPFSAHLQSVLPQPVFSSFQKSKLYHYEDQYE